jgi:hypothetical protein
MGPSGIQGEIGPSGAPGVPGSSYVSGCLDVNASGLAKNLVLKYNGTMWVPAAYDYNFAFSISSFNTNVSATQLIGSGFPWVIAGGVSFTAAYLNGPPTHASIGLTSTGGVTWSGNLNGVSPYANFTSVQNVNYPNAKDTTVTFTLYAQNSESGSLTSVVTFRNNVYYGITNKLSGYNSADVTGLTSVTTNSYTTGRTINCTAGNYILYAFPSSYTSLHGSGVLFNSVICPITAPETVSVTNASGFIETYKVYRSISGSLGNSTFTPSTSSTIINPIYYGVSTTSGTFTEIIVEGLANSVVSNTKGRTIVVTAGVGEYIVYALPVRLGTVTFTVGGFEGGFESPQTVSIMNVNGYTENYYVYRSTNSGLGSTTVVVA